MMCATEKYVTFFDRLDKNTPIEEYKNYFDENSYFEDPFQKVVGVDKIYHIFEDMYAKLHNPRFMIEEFVSNNNLSYIKWTFIYQMDENSQEQSFVGVSRVRFGENAKVLSHVDFWDAGANIYEKIPILGSVIRYIKRKIHA